MTNPLEPSSSKVTSPQENPLPIAKSTHKSFFLNLNDWFTKICKPFVNNMTIITLVLSDNYFCLTTTTISIAKH